MTESASTSEPQSKRGGKRPGAGRPKQLHNHDAPHRRRPELAPGHPVHIVLRTYMSWLRTGKMYRAIREVLRDYLGREDFRVCHLSIQKNHLHFLIEASDRKALSRGMQSLVSRAANALNRANHGGRNGEVFKYRYHSTQITTARQARNALAYVLNNWRKHREDATSDEAFKANLDPYASGISFDEAGAALTRFREHEGLRAVAGVAAADSTVAGAIWRRYGEIDLFEVPGQRRW